jgi:hypothetical protein
MKIQFTFFTFILILSLITVGCSNEKLTIEEKNSNELIDEYGFPPSIPGYIKVNETEYEMEAGNYRWERKHGLDTQVIQTDAASPSQIAENFKAIILDQSTNINIEIEGNPKISINLWNKNGIEKEVKLNNNQLLSPSSKGQYIYEVLAKWSNGEISYTFVAEVK